MLICVLMTLVTVDRNDMSNQAAVDNEEQTSKDRRHPQPDNWRLAVPQFDELVGVVLC